MEMLQIESLQELRNEIIYVNRNAFVAKPSYTPDSYPWGGGCTYFCPWLHCSFCGTAYPDTKRNPPHRGVRKYPILDTYLCGHFRFCGRSITSKIAGQAGNDVMREIKHGEASRMCEAIRAFGLGPSPRRKDAKRMSMGTCYAGFPGHAD